MPKIKKPKPMRPAAPLPPPDSGEGLYTGSGFVPVRTLFAKIAANWDEACRAKNAGTCPMAWDAQRVQAFFEKSSNSSSLYRTADELGVSVEALGMYLQSRHWMQPRKRLVEKLIEVERIVESPGSAAAQALHQRLEVLAQEQGTTIEKLLAALDQSNSQDEFVVHGNEVRSRAKVTKPAKKAEPKKSFSVFEQG